METQRTEITAKFGTSSLFRLRPEDAIGPTNHRNVQENPDKTHKFHTTRRYPIYYLAITKCGSTYMKNLFFALDNDGAHPDPNNIHEHASDLVRADFVPRWMIRRSAYSFTVLRNPVARFMSLYFDKIYGEHPGNFPDLRLDIAKEAGLDLSPGLSVEGHRTNALQFIEWLRLNIAHKTDLPVNPHWRPQMRRVKMVNHMALNFLTLEGLDWQLPIYLRGVVPEVQKAMSQIKTRNKASYPVDPAAVLTPELEATITDVYADDQAKWARADRWWNRRRNVAAPKPVQSDAPRLSVLTTYRHNLNTLAQPKAGISYIRNLHYALDHGRMHPTPDTIENDDCLVSRPRTAEEMAGCVNIVVMRNPVARFFSLYFDKIWSEGGRAFPWIAEKLRENRRFLGPSKPMGQAEHHDNCCRLLGYLETRFRERPTEELNPHWRPQIVRVRRAARFGFVPVILEDFSNQLTIVADGKIRGLPEALETTTYRNSSPKPISAVKLESPQILDRLHALYGDDIALYERIRAGWIENNAPPQL